MASGRRALGLDFSRITKDLPFLMKTGSLTMPALAYHYAFRTAVLRH
jgi:hypothetical protein